MQNNITEITQKLLGALDSNYNVTNMATIIEVISLLEKVTITKEMLETTRLGKHINELRKHLSNESLAKRAKLLVKKWRNSVLVSNPIENSAAINVPLATNGQIRSMPSAEDVKKRPLQRIDIPHAKKQRVNGGSTVSPFDYDFSDNSNSSFKDVPIVPKPVVVINSDSNSSMPEVRNDPNYEEQQPKKRGRKKGSKNHKNLLEEAESSFSNKMAVSRGNAKVKTTQELIESLQNRSHAHPTPPITSPKNIEDWRERAAKLTERVSLIDQKLNSGGRLKKLQRNNNKEVAPIKSSPGSRPATPDDEDEIVVVDDVPSAKWSEPTIQPAQEDPTSVENADRINIIPSLSVEEALSRLPPIDKSVLDLSEEEEGPCLCVLEESPDEPPKFRVHESCPARQRLAERYRLQDIGDEAAIYVHSKYVDSLNCNLGKCSRLEATEAMKEHRLGCLTTDSLSEGTRVESSSKDFINVNIVPNFYQLPAKDTPCSENYKKYSISEPPDVNSRLADLTIPAGDHGLVDYYDNSNDSSKIKHKDTAGTNAEPTKSEPESEIFREFHECVDRLSYNGDMLRILPYVVID